MNDRKQQVIKVSHQLFIKKGFQATSIQDILEESGISKGTFYNYFSSKNELLMELVKDIYKKMEIERNELLIGQSPADIGIFIQQVILLLKTNRTNNLLSIFEELIVSNDVELNQFFKKGQLRLLRWLYHRFLDIFGESYKPYLLDSAIMFLGILQYNLKYYAIAYGKDMDYELIVRFSVQRIVKMVHEFSETNDTLFDPELINRWLPDSFNSQSLQQKLHSTILEFKETLTGKQIKYIELLDFVDDELIHSKHPREVLIESVLLSLTSDPSIKEKKELKMLEKLIREYLKTV